MLVRLAVTCQLLVPLATTATIGSVVHFSIENVRVQVPLVHDNIYNSKF